MMRVLVPIDPAFKARVDEAISGIRASARGGRLPFTAAVRAALEQWIRRFEAQDAYLEGPTMSLYRAQGPDGAAAMPLEACAEIVYALASSAAELFAVERDVLDASFKAIGDGERVELRGTRFSGAAAEKHLGRALVLKSGKLFPVRDGGAFEIPLDVTDCGVQEAADWLAIFGRADTLTAAGVEMGVSRERARQVANALGVRPLPRPSPLVVSADGDVHPWDLRRAAS